MKIAVEVEVKAIGFKPVRKGKSELQITLVAESEIPGSQFAELMDKNQKVVRVIFLDSENEDVSEFEMRRDA